MTPIEKLQKNLENAGEHQAAGRVQDAEEISLAVAVACAEQWPEMDPTIREAIATVISLQLVS